MCSVKLYDLCEMSVESELGHAPCGYCSASPEAGQENTLFLALARLIGALPVEGRLRLLGTMRNGHETAQREAAAVTA